MMDISVDTDKTAYLGGLDDEQRAAVLSPSKDLAVTAPAGAGKSTTIAARARSLEDMGVDGNRLVAVCFGHDAAQSIGEKMRKVGAHGRAMTIHHLALRLLRREREASTTLPARVVLCSLDGADGDHATNAELRQALGRWVKTAKARWPGDGLTIRRAREAVARIESGGTAQGKAEAYIWAQYGQWMRNRSRDEDVTTDYGFAVLRAASLLSSAPDGADWVPKVSALIVDEAQDVSGPQRRLLEALHPEWLSLVGDADQAIYGFQGGDPSWLVTGHDRIRLVTDYRSTAAIVRVAAAVSGHVMKPAPDADEGDPVVLYRADDEADEDAWVADQVRALLAAGIPPIPGDESGIAILTREAERGQRLADYLASQGLRGKVEVTTVHSFKGRQAEAVLVAGLSDEVWCKDDEDEARRVLYVAVSRAKHHLYLSYAGTETITHRSKAVHPLRLLDGLPVTDVTGHDRSLVPTVTPEVEAELTSLYEALGDRKNQADRIARFYRLSGDESKARRMEGCASLAVFAHSVRTDPETMETLDRWALESADYCHVRLCPMCQWRVSREQWLRLSAIHWWAMTVNHQRYQEGDPRRYQDPLLVTLTIPNVRAEDLGAAIRLLGQAWHRMSVVPSWDKEHRTRRWRLWSKVLPGEWRTIETTFNAETGTFHPHMHVLMLATAAYARPFHRDDPSREGVDWVRRDDGKFGSPYYLSTREWAEMWTKNVLAAHGVRQSSKLEIEDDPDGGLLVRTPHVNGGNLLVDVRRTDAGSGDLSEVTKYVTKDLSLFPPSISDSEGVERLEVLDSALERVHLIVQRGVYKTILDRASAGMLKDWMAGDPSSAETLDMDELVSRFKASQGMTAAWTTDRRSYAGWTGQAYAERYRRSVEDEENEADEDPFDDDDDEDW